MEYDLESSCEDHCLRDFENPDDQLTCSTPARERCDRVTCHSPPTMAEQSLLERDQAKKSLSAQVMEYYHKYSRGTNLHQYFSLPVTNTSQEAVKYYYGVYEVSTQVDTLNRQDCVGEEYHLKSHVPRERRRWVRPPLIGQSSNADASSTIPPLTDPQTPSPDFKRVTPETIQEEKNESQERFSEVSDRKLSSPTSSVASYKPLEWDSGADVGYFNLHAHNKHNEKKLSTIERMALARGCSAALRLDPEGTTESGMQSGKNAATQNASKLSAAPNANSTPLVVGNASGSESEIEITPIVKNHLPGIITGDDIKSQERCVAKDAAQPKAIVKPTMHEVCNFETPTSSTAFKVPLVKYLTVERRIVNKQKETTRSPSSPNSPLKKSISMNVIPVSLLKSSLKRSQSELNLHSKEGKTVLPLIFNSTSSIATIVNKPVTCDKVIQTSPDVCSQESIGVQVSDLEERSSLTEKDVNLQTTIHSILKKSKGTYRVKNPRKSDASHAAGDADVTTSTKENQRRRSSSDISQNASTSVTPQPDETENVSGKANSFEYFPGHAYANVPNGRDNHVSSDTGRSNSTLPNSSSSVNEKLWGDSDSLVRDLERSVNILKSLVDANKCDKQVKKRLIQHVIKRLITAKYMDDKIEHNLEDNVPWNPDDARNKVYRAELLQALANKHSTTESSDEWNLRKKDVSMQKSVGTISDVIKEVALESSNSDKFDRHTDRTEIDGRKTRLGLRTDDCRQSSNISPTTDPDKSESSECFVPQRNPKNAKVNGMFCFKENCKLPHRESTTTNSIPPDHNRILLDAVVNNRRTPVESNNNTDNNTDWRLPTTSSERRFELKKCSMSESGDSKLVNYAEMEKRNQLIWITNEISHLCNLKKLLEQPRRLERPKSSPRKSKSANFKSKQTASVPRREQHVDAVHRSTSDLREDSTNEPWSSHCNLAACEATENIIIQRVMKRNSCTQTATNAASVYSKTGGEIVSASSIRGFTKHVSVSVQTSPREIPATSAESHTRETKSVNSRNACARYQTGVKCKDQSCQTTRDPAVSAQCTCARCNRNASDAAGNLRNLPGDAQSVSQQTQTSNYASDTSTTERACHHAPQTNSVQQKQKDAKNQINTSKSKHGCVHGTCPSVNDNKRGSGVAEPKRVADQKRALLAACPSCSRQKPVNTGNATCNCRVCQKNPSRMHGDGFLEDDRTCVCANACKYPHNGPGSDADERIVLSKMRQSGNAQSQNGHASKYNAERDVGKVCDCANDCATCENPRGKAEALCECRSNGKIDGTGLCRFECRLKIAERQSQARAYSDSSQGSDTIQQRRVQSSLKCNCDEACSCSNKNQTMSEDNVNGRAWTNYVLPKSSLVDDISINKTDKRCKHCRVCGAMYQNTRKCDCRQTYPRAVAYELSFTKGNASRSEISDVVQVMPKGPKLHAANAAAPSDGCNACDIKNKNNSSKNFRRTNSLQDYLSRNNPEFVGNAETRRQYLSEICQLRELRKEKRIQLLAMASTSNIIKSGPTPKPTVSAQPKITDKEMKERLRKRYLRLNEVRFKRRQQEKQEEARRNKLMAKIFCKRLQQKVLRGQVDLSQSVSVISNL